MIEYVVDNRCVDTYIKVKNSITGETLLTPSFGPAEVALYLYVSMLDVTICCNLDNSYAIAQEYGVLMGKKLCEEQLVDINNRYGIVTITTNKGAVQ